MFFSICRLYFNGQSSTLLTHPFVDFVFKPRQILSFCIIYVLFNFSSPSFASTNFLQPQYDTDEYYSETFTVFADIPDGQYLYAQIGISNLGPGDRNGFCRIMLAKPEQQTFNHSKIYKNSGWHYSSLENETLKIGDCALEKNKSGIVFTGTLENKSLMVNLQSKPTFHAIPHNKLRKKDGRYQPDILVPWSRAKARLNEHSLSGFGYADHSISTLLPASLAFRWIRIRAINEGNAHLALVRYPDNKNRPHLNFSGWIWQQKQQPKLLKHVQYTPSTLPKVSLGYDEQTMSVSATDLLFRQAPLEENGVLGTLLSKIIGNPVTYTYRASIKTSQGKHFSGILEVANTNE